MGKKKNYIFFRNNIDFKKYVTCYAICIRQTNLCGDRSWTMVILGSMSLSLKGYKGVFCGTGYVLDLDVGTSYMGELICKNLICNT